MRATVHVGPKGGIEYRLWTSDDIFRIVGKYKALPHMTPEERVKADAMEADRKASLKAKSAADAAWRSVVYR